ncbi:MAG: 50S ribosomal protein L21 [Syntrophaceae bacterium]
MYAVIKTGGKQYRVSEGDFISVELLETEAGATVTFNEVLMVAKDGDVRVGRPFLENARVIGEVIDLGKGPKITIFKHKRRKGFRKKTGHRQPVVNLKIKEISA